MSAVNEFYNLKSMLRLTDEEHEFFKTYEKQRKKVVPISSAQVKKCKICGQIKPVTEFYKCANTKDGYYSECMVCKSEKSKQQYLRKKQEKDAQKKVQKEENEKDEVNMPNLNITDADFIALCREIAYLRSELEDQKILNEYLRKELQNAKNNNRK